MPATWVAHSKEVLGYVADLDLNQRYVSTIVIQDLINQGYTVRQIGHIWNGGTATCRRGTNSWGVRYDSCAYGDKLVAKVQ